MKVSTIWQTVVAPFEDGGERFICRFNNFHDNQADEHNALLTSCAPEMLDLLIRFVKKFDEGNADDFNLRDEAENLIKKATEF